VEILSSCREKSLVFARQVGMYLVRRLTDHSLEEIGGFFGGRDHATVIYSVRKIELASSVNTGVRKDIEAILSRLRKS
jgi:chromosomal replication initiator protein